MRRSGQGSLLNTSSSMSQDLATAEIPPAAAAAADAAAALLTASLASLAAAELYCNRCRFDSTSSRSAAEVGFLRKGSKTAVPTHSGACIQTNILQHPSRCDTESTRAMHDFPRRSVSTRAYIPGVIANTSSRSTTTEPAGWRVLMLLASQSMSHPRWAANIVNPNELPASRQSVGQCSD